MNKNKEELASASKRKFFSIFAMFAGLIISHSLFGAYVIRFLLPRKKALEEFKKRYIVKQIRFSKFVRQ